MFNIGTAMQSLDIGRKLEAYTGVIIHAGQDDNGNAIDITSGNNSGYVLEFDNPIGTQQMADAILANLRLRGVRYQPFEAGMAEIDPACEIGDGVTVNGTESVIMSIDSDHTSKMFLNIAAPMDEEVDHEFKYESKTAREFKRETSYARSRISQTATAISLEVARATASEGELSGRITVQADRITSEVTRATVAEGTLSSRITQTSDAITSEVTRATTAEGNLGTRIDQRLDGITLTATSSNGTSTFTIKDGSTTLDTKTLDLSVKSVNISGTLTIGQLPSTVAETSDIPTNVSQLNNDSGYQNASQVTTITNDTISTTNVLAQNLQVNSANINGLLSATQLAVGTDSNLFPDYDSFEQITNDTLYYAKSSELTAEVLDSAYAREGRKLMRLQTGDSVSNAYVFIGHSTTNYAQVRVHAGRYIFSFYGRKTSGNVQVKTVVYGRSAQGSSWSDSSVYTGLATNTTTFSGDYVRVEMPFTVTSDKPYVCVRFQVMTANNAVLIDCLQLEKLANSSQTAGAWHTAGTTTINGGNITANTITATQIAANAITSAKIAAGAITADKLSVTDLSAIGATIGGWKINSNEIRKTVTNAYDTALCAPSSPVAADYVFYARKYVSNAWEQQFYVKYDGTMFAKNATISGTITATAGTIGGVTISNGVLSGINDTNIQVGGISGGSGGSIGSGTITTTNTTSGINTSLGYADFSNGVFSNTNTASYIRATTGYITYLHATNTLWIGSARCYLGSVEIDGVNYNVVRYYTS